MNKKKSLIIIIFILVIALIFSISSLAIVNSDIFEANIFNNKIQRTNAEKTKVFSIDNGVEKQLTYKETQNYSASNYVDIYEDSEKNQYRYDNQENLIGYINNNIDDKLESQIIDDKALDSRISQDEAISIATAYAQKMYQNTFDDFNYSSSLYAEHSNLYNIHFNVTAGKDKQISVATCYVGVYLSGKVASCNMPTWYEKSKIDFNKLNRISKSDLEKFADNEAKEIYGNDFVNCYVYEEVGAFLTAKDNSFVVAVPIIVTLKNINGDNYDMVKELYYEFT